METVMRWVILALLCPSPLFAQTTMRQDVERERQRYDGLVSPTQVAAILNAVAWARRAEGWGMLAKPDGAHIWLGDNGPFIAGDILMNAQTCKGYDVLEDWDSGKASPIWIDKGACDMARFVAPIPSAVGGGETGGGETGGGGESPASAASAAEVDRMINAALATQMGVFKGRRISTADVYEQTERTFTDLRAAIADVRQAVDASRDDLAKKIDEPMWFTKVMRHPIVKYGAMIVTGIVAQKAFHVFGDGTTPVATP